jgi:hypothetical protein
MFISLTILGVLFTILLLCVAIRLLWEFKEDLRSRWCITQNKKYRVYITLTSLALILTTIICFAIPFAFAFLILFLFA